VPAGPLLCCVVRDDALLDFERVHVSVEQALTPKKLPVDADRWRHFASADQGAKMADRVAEVLRRVAGLEVWVAIAVLVHRHHRFALVDDEWIRFGSAAVGREWSVMVGRLLWAAQFADDFAYPLLDLSITGDLPVVLL
jgi:hypothetical protein